MNMPLTPSPRRTWRRWMLAPVALLTAGALVSLAVVGADAPPNIRAANIATDPLYAATQGDKPALALAPANQLQGQHSRCIRRASSPAHPAWD